MERKFTRFLALLAVVLIVSSVVLAQASRNLTFDVPVEATLDADNPAQTYTFTLTQESNVTLTAEGADGLALAIVVTDVQGTTVGQVTDNEGAGTIALTGLELLPGSYYVTVFPYAGAGETTEGDFTLTLSLADGTASPAATQVQITPLAVDADATEETTPAPDATEEAAAAATDEPDAQDAPAGDAAADAFSLGQIVTTNGILVRLGWAATSDMNLEVRDPVNRRLYYASTSTDNGGTFGFDVNSQCEILQPQAEETAEWAPGALPTGSYEVLVYYRQDCEGVGEVPFTVDVTVDGETLDTVQASLTPPVNENDSSVYITSFRVNEDGTAELGPAGLYTDTRTLPIPQTEIVAEAGIPVEIDSLVNGVITTDTWYDVYKLTTTEPNQAVTVSMNITEGNLDTLLLVLDQTGAIVGDNDDLIAGVNTNSLIENLVLLNPGTYTIMATRYGKDVGGTEGTYELAVTSGGEALPQEVQALNLPPGDLAVTLVWNTPADLQLLVRDPSNVSTFDDAPTPANGSQLFANGNANCQASQIQPPTSHIYFPNGRVRAGSYEIQVLYQNTCNNTTPTTFDLYITFRGELLAVQRGNAAQQGDNYITSVNVSTDGTTAEVGLGGPVLGSADIIGDENYPAELADAEVLESGQTITQRQITTDDRYQIYQFEAEAGDTINIVMNAQTGTLDPLLFLLDPSGFEAAANDDIAPNADPPNRNSQITYDAPVDGTYTIIATHFGTIYGVTSGAYSLTLTLE